jgi:YebC/PmpR family DNA-binding regulatory protein
MSGHSHCKTIKRVKDAHDLERGKVFSKLARMISVAVKDGADPALNSKLRQVLDEAKKFNMPKDKVEKAIKRGTGEIEGGRLEEIIYEAFGPGGIAIIIECITDNKNRTLSEVKHVLQKYNGKLAESGSVKWLFERKGIITLQISDEETSANKDKDSIELIAIESGAEDIDYNKEENVLDIYTKTEELEKVKENLTNKKIEIDSSCLGWVAKENIDVNEKEKTSCEKVFEELDEKDDVQNIYSNLKAN